jgi:hypothetical protein
MSDVIWFSKRRGRRVSEMGVFEIEKLVVIMLTTMMYFIANKLTKLKNT